jgi:hypothetical protein
MQQAHRSEPSSLLHAPQCMACGGSMRLVLIEPEGDAPNTDTRHFTCGATAIRHEK